MYYFTANNIPETHKHLELKTAKSPNPRFELYYYCQTSTNHNGTEKYYSISSPVFGITHKGVLCLLQEYRGKYHIHPDWHRINKLTFSSYEQTELLKHLQEPNRIGVFSDKKINEWLEFCVEKVRILDEYEAIHKEKNATILAEIEEIKKIGKAGGYDNRTRIDTILFRIDLTHCPETAFLDKKITFNGGVDDVKKIMEAMEFKAKIQRHVNRLPNCK